MKKRLVLVTLVAALGLASCGEKKEKDETAPVISGAENVSCAVNETIDLLKGVSAVDDVDGDLTSSIQITLMPSLTVTSGKVTPTLDGDYEVKYAVKDKAGNEGTAFATLNVTPALAEKKEYKKYEFGAAGELPFTLWNFKQENPEADLDVSGSVVKGNYQIKATKTDKEAWHIKYEGKTATKAGATYVVTYELNSSVAGNVTFEAYGLGAFTKGKELAVGSNKLEFEFIAAEEKEEQGYCLQLGSLDPFTLDISKITVKEVIGEDVFSNVLATGYSMAEENVVTSAFDNNSTGTVTTTPTSATIDITRGSDENGVWQTKLFVKAGLDLEANSKYRISVDLLAEKDLNQFEICYNNGDVEKGIGALYGQSLVANTAKTIEFIAMPDTAKDNLTLQFQLGCLNDPQGSNKITVSNLKVEKAVTEDEEVVNDYVFPSDPSGLYSHFWSDAQGSVTVSGDQKELTYTVTKAPTNPNVWELNVQFPLNITLLAKREYTISVDILADHNLPSSEMQLRKGLVAEPNYGGNFDFTAEANKSTTVSFKVNLTEDLENASIGLALGRITEAMSIKVSNVKVVAAGGQKEESETGFVFTPEGFGTYNDAANAEGYLYVSDGKMIYELNKIGLTDWHNKMYIEKIKLESDKIYTISFKAKASENISCAFFLNVFGGWDPRLSGTVNFTTTEQTFEYTTTSAFATDMFFEILWQFGSEENSKKSNVTVEFSDITIYSQDVE